MGLELDTYLRMCAMMPASAVAVVLLGEATAFMALDQTCMGLAQARAGEPRNVHRLLQRLYEHSALSAQVGRAQPAYIRVTRWIKPGCPVSRAFPLQHRFPASG